ncbi:4,5-DOPA dioxygenase extradiol [Arachidicoccus ginsenosidimutans]|uniref:4,5-DOPA-extradiol-dioxygenase n=1 Tax=Arachidicoccus sp. BS20 TaxID=1850526 RepID=UPI0007F11C3E|nr:4,5-DOPA dioxygenase extradiol [Arachidicoccus sp. BS20]ANI89126.1 4,5-DOPA dioxygenase extradiol [Arachidicoccus sp. BS20]
MSNLQTLKSFTDTLKQQSEYAPLLFIGHGSPMNGIEQNTFSDNWELVGKNVEPPKAVLVISAHWLTHGTYVTAMEKPATIHDFGGFPRALYEVEYPAKGSPVLADEIKTIITKTDVGLNHDWGLDHGAWSVVRHIFPEANIPVLQLSIDYHKPAAYHYALAKELHSLRKKGVMIIGSGNIIHNLRLVDWQKLGEENYGYDWALELNELFKSKILHREHDALVDYQNLSKAALLAVPTPDHYYPLIYSLALQNDNEDTVFFNDALVGGSLNMTSVLFA